MQLLKGSIMFLSIEWQCFGVSEGLLTDASLECIRRCPDAYFPQRNNNILIRLLAQKQEFFMISSILSIFNREQGPIIIFSLLITNIISFGKDYRSLLDDSQEGNDFDAINKEQYQGISSHNRVIDSIQTYSRPQNLSDQIFFKSGRLHTWSSLIKSLESMQITWTPSRQASCNIILLNMTYSYNIYRLQDCQSTKSITMDLSNVNYYHPYHYIHPYSHLYAYWTPNFPQQHMLYENPYPLQPFPKIQEQACNIIQKTHPEPLKTEQFSNLVEQAQKSSRLFEQAQIAQQKINDQQVAQKGQSRQKENRNVYSNILRSFFRKLNDSSKIKDLVKKIIQKRNLQITAQAFLTYLKRLKINHGKYLRFKKLRHLFIDERLRQHAKVFRILYQKFLNEDLPIISLTSRKIGKWSVILHLKGGRDLKKKIFY